MELLKLFMVFTVFYAIFHWIFRKTDLHNRLIAKSQKNKFTRVILILMLFFIAFRIEVEKQSLQEMYGKYSFLSIIVAAFLGSFYLNFVPMIFRKSKS